MFSFLTIFPNVKSLIPNISNTNSIFVSCAFSTLPVFRFILLARAVLEVQHCTVHSPRFSNQVMWFINLNACVLPRKSAGTRRLWQRRGGMNTEDGCTRQEKSEGTWGDEEPCNACIPSLLPWARHPSPTRQGENGAGADEKNKSVHRDQTSTKEGPKHSLSRVRARFEAGHC